MTTLSLQGRLLAWVLGIAVLLWCGTALLIWRDARVELDDLLDGHLTQAAALLVVQQGNEISDGDFDLDAPALHRLGPKVAFQVLRGGSMLMHSSNAPHTTMIQDEPGPVTGFRTVKVDGAQWRVFGAYGAEHAIQVYVAERVDSRSAILQALLRAMLWPALAAIPVWMLAITWSVRHATEPLRRLGRLLARREPDEADPLSQQDIPLELHPVVHALNTLFARTAALLRAERRFTSDASHELRTPIAAIRAQAQVAQVEADPDRRLHALAATVQGCDRASHLVDQLLQLSRLEAEGAAPARVVDAPEVVRQVLAEVAERALAKGQTIDFDAEGALQVRGEPALLGVLVRNLADNAVRYSPRGAEIHVQLVGGEAGVQLLIEDSGPGMSDADLQRIGERFFRVLGSEEEGSGLGWSIVQRIAAVQGATIRVGRSARLGGLRVAVDWPPPT